GAAPTRARRRLSAHADADPAQSRVVRPDRTPGDGVETSRGRVLPDSARAHVRRTAPRHLPMGGGTPQRAQRPDPAAPIMTISHTQARVKARAGGVAWFKSVCDVASSFPDARMAVFEFGAFTLILDSAPEDSMVTLGFQSDDCDADFQRLVEHGGKP